MIYIVIKYVWWICIMIIKIIWDLVIRIMMIKVVNLIIFRDWEYVYRMNFLKDIVVLIYKVVIKVWWFFLKVRKCFLNCLLSWMEEVGIVCWKVSDVVIVILIRICEKRYFLFFNLRNYYGDWWFLMVFFCVV